MVSVNGWSDPNHIRRHNKQPIGESVALKQLNGLIQQLTHWQPEIIAALHHGANAHTFDDVVNMIITGRVHFYPFEQAFVIMEVVTYNQFKIYHCFLAGGELKHVLQCEPMMLEAAKMLECKYISVAGRRGWEKYLGNNGWRHISTVMYKEVEP